MNQKITPKNVWSLDTIDVFTTKSTTIQTAANILSTCSQIYSVRCDDISNKTSKLLDTFQFTTKKKKKIVTGDTNKDFLSCEWADPLFSKILKGKLDFVMQDGYLKLYGVGGELFESKFDGGDFILKNKVLCPDFGNIDCDEIEFEGVDDIMDDFPVDYDVNIEVPEENEYPADEPLIKKGWAGPDYWKVSHKRVKNVEKIRKKKEKTVIDYNQSIDRKKLLVSGKNNLTPGEIRDRKKNYYFLPNDYQLNVDDIYKYLVIEGNFRNNKSKQYKDTHKGFAAVFDEVPESFGHNEELPSIMPEPLIATEIVTDFGNSKFSEAARNLFKKCAKVQKPVDIKKIKELMYNKIEKNNKKLIDIYSDISGNKEDEISIHYCIVSLLHLANEKNVRIEKSDENICIKR